MILFEPQDALTAWLCQRVKYVPTPNMVTIANFSENERRIIGAVGYDQWSDKAVEMHMAGHGNWITREFLWKAFAYPFIQGKKEWILGRVDSENTDALRLDFRIGFKEMGRIPGAGEDGDLIIVAMHKDECRWLKPLPYFKRREVA